MIAHDPSNLHVHLGYWLRLVSNKVSQSFAAKVDDLGVTVAEWVLLRVLFDHKTTQPRELAKLTGLTKGAVSKLVDRLVDKKMMRREFSSVDRRQQNLSLTFKGRGLVPNLAKLADQNEAEYFGSLSSTELTLLFQILEKIAKTHGIEEIPLE